MMRFKELKNNLKSYLGFIKALKDDKRVPLVSKMLFWIALAYFFSPIDLIPDFIPIFGQLDDLIIVPGLICLACLIIPKGVYRENYEKMFGKMSKKL